MAKQTLPVTVANGVAKPLATFEPNRKNLWPLISFFSIVFIGVVAVMVYGVSRKHTHSSTKAPNLPYPPTLSTTTLPWEVDQTVPRRLPNYIWPSHYDVNIMAYIDPAHPRFLTFDGEVTIHATTGAYASVQHLQLNAKELDMNLTESSIVEVDGSNAVGILGAEAGGVSDIIVIHTTQALRSNSNYTLRLKYTGKVNRYAPGAGLFYKTYKANGTQRYMFATDNECCGARRIFPSFDEPNFKATFTLTLETDTKRSLISNTEPVETTGNKVRFAKTPKMSSYLFAFAILDDFVSLESTTRDGTSIKTWVRPEKRRQAELVANISASVLDWYSDLFGIPYKDYISKLDQIIVPPTLTPMENWGMITYGEENSLFDPWKDPPSVAEFAILMVTHEMAHMWFGNLVTMDWWDQIWLNEGIVDYLDYYGNQAVASLKGSAEQLLLTVSAEDVLQNGQRGKIDDPMIKIPNEESVINGNSQIVTEYEKPETTIMAKLQGYIGWDNLRNGLRSVLQSYGLSNYNQSQLFSTISNSSTVKFQQSLFERELRNNATPTLNHQNIGFGVLKSFDDQEKASVELHLEFEAVYTESKATLPVTIVEQGSVTPWPPGNGTFQSYYISNNDGLHGLYFGVYYKPGGADVLAYMACVVSGRCQPNCVVAAKTIRDILSAQIVDIGKTLDYLEYSVSQCYATLFYASRGLGLVGLGPQSTAPGNTLQLLRHSDSPYAEKYSQILDQTIKTFGYPPEEFDPVNDNMLDAMATEQIMPKLMLLWNENVTDMASADFEEYFNRYKSNPQTARINPLLKFPVLCSGFANKMTQEIFNEASSLQCTHQDDQDFLRSFGCVRKPFLSQLLELIWVVGAKCDLSKKTMLVVSNAIADYNDDVSGALTFIQRHYNVTTMDDGTKLLMLQATASNVFTKTDVEVVDAIVADNHLKFDNSTIEQNVKFLESSLVQKVNAWAATRLNW